ncbi:hypothetical protein [Vibrio ouci]|uniref:Uncharacterized protein n=1 Tax=Vibrio ouci TaxID=2499078 RepID=A0A4Y8W838_9VIBR|nr:hypothetical protein [Vibrio ouci]TFH89080.1 hypothetical protein ELS82_24205 [Vibrio ouci]
MKKIIVFALFCTLLVMSVYISKFGFVLSDEHSRWADFGSFLGGTLGSIFTFCSLLYLAHQIEMQRTENRQARVEVELNYKERNIDENLTLLLPKLNSIDPLINATLAELILRTYGNKPIAENNPDLFRLAFSARAEILVIWVNISAALSYLESADKSRYLSKKTLVVVQLSSKLCTALDYVARESTGIKFDTHF